MSYDITFCSNEECALKKDCHRSLSNLKIVKKEWLSVSYFFPKEDGFCTHFWKKEPVSEKIDEKS